MIKKAENKASEKMTLKKDIVAYRKDDLIAAITKLNKKAIKLGFDPINISFGREYTQELETKSAHGIFKHKIEFIETEIEYDIPNIDGWLFHANFESVPTPKGNMIVVNQKPDIEIPQKYQEKTKIDCQHCNHKRLRNKSYLLYNPKTKEYKEVGSTCLKDFNNGNDPAQFLFAATKIFGFFEDFFEDEDFNQYRNSGHCGYDLKSILVISSACISQWGYTSKTAAYNNPKLVSTAIDVMNQMHPTYATVKVEIKDTDRKNAEETIEWFKTQKNDNSYMANCLKMIEHDFVSDKHIGYAASMIYAYQKHLGKVAASKNKKQSDFQGKVKERMKGLKLTCTFKRFFDNDFGGTELCKFVDSDGNIFQSWVSASSKFDTKVNDIMIIDGTVKAHDDSFQNIKVTVLTRIKLVNLLASGLPTN